MVRLGVTIFPLTVEFIHFYYNQHAVCIISYYYVPLYQTRH